MKNKLLRYIELIFVAGIMNFSCVNNNNFGEENREKEMVGGGSTEEKNSNSKKKTQSMTKPKKETQEKSEKKRRAIEKQELYIERRMNKLSFMMGILLEYNYTFEISPIKKPSKRKIKKYFDIINIKSHERKIVFNAKDDDFINFVSENTQPGSSRFKYIKDFTFKVIVEELEGLKFTFIGPVRQVIQATKGIGLIRFTSIKGNGYYPDFSDSAIDYIGSALYELFYSYLYTGKNRKNTVFLNKETPDLLLQINEIFRINKKKIGFL